MPNKYTRLILVAMLLLVTTMAFAQGGPGFPFPGNGRPPTPPPPFASIDGGILALLALGAGFGVKKLREKK